MSCDIKDRSSLSAVRDPIPWIKFEWEGDSLGNRYFEHSAMLLPVRFEGVPLVFTFQFDLGAPVSMVYGNSFATVLQHYPSLGKNLDTLERKVVIQGKKLGALRNLSFLLDTVSFAGYDFAFFEGFGDTVMLKKTFSQDTIPFAGTIGRDLCREKVLIIDFPNQRLAFLDSLPGEEKYEPVTLKTEHDLIAIPIVINGDTSYVLYDTGSSMAPLFLSTKNWDPYRDTTSMTDTLFATAWGTTYPLFVSKTDMAIRIGKTVFHPGEIMANNLEPYYAFFRQNGVLGIMGNAMFLNKIIFLDMKNGKFGIIHN